MKEDDVCRGVVAPRVVAISGEVKEVGKGGGKEDGQRDDLSSSCQVAGRCFHFPTLGSPAREKV